MLIAFSLILGNALIGAELIRCSEWAFASGPIGVDARDAVRGLGRELITLPVDEMRPLRTVTGFRALFPLRQASRHWKPRRRREEIDGVLDAGAVLFLRPIEEDEVWDGARTVSFMTRDTWTRFPLGPSDLTAPSLIITGRSSSEQAVAFVTRRIGKMDAVGKPGSPYPRRGERLSRRQPLAGDGAGTGAQGPGPRRFARVVGTCSPGRGHRH